MAVQDCCSLFILASGEWYPNHPSGDRVSSVINRFSYPLLNFKIVLTTFSKAADDVSVWYGSAERHGLAAGRGHRRLQQKGKSKNLLVYLVCSPPWSR
jgi:hypothetical protein